MHPPSISKYSIFYSNKIQAKCIYKTAAQIVDNVLHVYIHVYSINSYLC